MTEHLHTGRAHLHDQAIPEVTDEQARSAGLVMAAAALRAHVNPEEASCGLRVVLEALSIKEGPFIPLGKTTEGGNSR